MGKSSKKLREKLNTSKEYIKWGIRVLGFLGIVAILIIAIFIVTRVYEFNFKDNWRGNDNNRNRWNHTRDDSVSGSSSWSSSGDGEEAAGNCYPTDALDQSDKNPRSKRQIQEDLDPDFDLRKRATFCVAAKTLSSFGCNTNNGHCLVEFDRIIAVAGIGAFNESVILIANKNYYNIFAQISNNLQCPFRTMEVLLMEINSNTVLEKVHVSGIDSIAINTSVVLEAGAKVGFFIKYFGSILPYKISISGSIAKEGNYDNLVFVTNQDLALKIRYVPTRPTGLTNPPFPDQYPTISSIFAWFRSVIPFDFVTGPLPVGLPNRDRYDKFRSVQYSIGFYLGLDMNTIDPKDPKLSIFLTNWEDRGKDNYRKKVYMTALTSGMMPHYQEKITSFINEVYSNTVTYGKPVLSSFKVALVNFFLAIHVGYDDYPDYVIDYFTKFIDVIGFGNPLHPGRNEAMMFGSQNIGRVREYFEHRNTVVKANLDETSLIYHWHLAGLHPEGLVMESVHNIVAFSQFNNLLFLIINDRLMGTPVPIPPGFIKYDFFSRYGNATTDIDRLNVVREIYRLLVPNSVSFSRVKEQNPADPSVTIQSRHVHKAIMVTAANITSGGNPAAYFTYNVDQYAPFNTDFSETSCPFQGLDTNPHPYKPEDLFESSVVDGETLQDKCNNKMFPVYPLPIYAPFGLGYRRCAGEVLNYYLTMQLVDKFRTVDFEFRTVTPQTGVVTLAPFTSVPDNLYILAA